MRVLNKKETKHKDLCAVCKPEIPDVIFHTSMFEFDDINVREQTAFHVLEKEFRSALSTGMQRLASVSSTRTQETNLKICKKKLAIYALRFIILYQGLL